MTEYKRWLFLAVVGLFIGFSIASSLVSAAGACVVTSPSGDIWYNKVNTIDIRCTCPAGTTQLKNTFITKFYSTPVIFSGVDTTWTYGLNIDNRLETTKYGRYFIDGECLDGNYTKLGNFSGSFDVHELAGMVVAPAQAEPYDLYLTNTTSIEYKVFKDGNLVTLESLAMSGGTMSFVAYLNNDATPDKKVADTNSASYDPAKQSWIIPVYQLNTVAGLSSENIYNLKTTMTYSEPPSTSIQLSGSIKDALKTRKSLVATVVPGSIPSIMDVTGSTRADVKLRVIYLGEPAEDLDVTHFDVYMENKDGERTRNLLDEKGFMYNEGDGYYVLPVEIVNMEPGSYDLKISVWHTGVGEVIIKASTVRFVLAFQGQIVDSNDNVVSARIILRNNLTEIPITTDGAGKYSVPITADTYDIFMRFPEVWKVQLDDVEITGNTVDPINYDYFSGDPNIEGLTVAKLVVLEFSLPFEKAYLEIPYNDAMVDNEKNIKTYECTNWNFGKRKCIGEWRDVSSVVNPVSDLVSFNTNMMTAFVIGERRGLWLDASLDRSDYFAFESMTLSGKVVDTKSNGIEGVTVDYFVDGTDIAGKTTSGPGGIFTAILSAPDEAGVFTLTANAKRSPYVYYNMTYQFEVAKKKEVNLQVPETMDFMMDVPTTMKMTVFNTGQTELTNVRVSIAGLKDTWYKLEPALFESIPPGQRKNVDLNVNIPSSECADDKCSKYYFVNVDFKSNEISEKAAFTAKIKTNESVAITATSGTTPFSMNLPDITGLVSMPAAGSMPFSDAGRTNMYLSLFFILAAFVAITIKKRQRRGGFGGRYGRGMRTGVSSTINAIKPRLGRRR